MANKKPAPKSKTKSSSKTAPTIKPFDGKITPFGSNKSYKPTGSSVKKSTSSKSSTSNTAKSKTPVKKSGVTNTAKTAKKPVYAKPGTPSKPTIVKPDSKGVVRVKDINKGDYIIDLNKKSNSKKKTTSTSKSNPAYVKGVVEGLDRPQPKKKTEPQKPKAPKMATTIGSAKVSVPSKDKVKIEPNLGKPKSYTPPKVETKKVETKKVETKAAPKPELIKMETVSSAKAAEQLMESRNIPTQLAGVNTSTPAPEEKKTRLERKIERRADRAERREERDIRREERRAEKDQENVAKMKKGGIMKYKTGGMVNPNAKLQADKKAGSKGVKHSLSVKAVVQKIAKGRSGGTSAAPKTALPKAQEGGSLISSKNNWREKTSSDVKKKLAKGAVKTAIPKAKYGMTMKKK